MKKPAAALSRRAGGGREEPQQASQAAGNRLSIRWPAVLQILRDPGADDADQHPNPDAHQGLCRMCPEHQAFPRPDTISAPVDHQSLIHGRVRLSSGPMSGCMIRRSATMIVPAPIPIPSAVRFRRGTVPSTAPGALMCRTAPMTARSTIGDTTSEFSSHSDGASRQGIE